MDLLLNTIALDPNRWTAGKIPFFSLDALLPAVARAGFDRLELWQPHATTPDAATLRRTRALADDLGVSCVVLGLYPHLDLDPAARRAARETWNRWFEAGHILGVEGVKLFVGDRGSAALGTDGRARTLDALDAFLSRAADAGLWVTGETHPDTLFDSVDATLHALDHFTPGRLDVCFQPYDFTDTDRALADYGALRDHVRHLHFQGRRGDRIVRLADAELDYGRLIEAYTAPPVPALWSIEFVQDGIVDDPADFDLDHVLGNAHLDRVFVQRHVSG